MNSRGPCEAWLVKERDDVTEFRLSSGKSAAVFATARA